MVIVGGCPAITGIGARVDEREIQQWKIASWIVVQSNTLPPEI